MSTVLNATPLGLVARWSTRSQEQARRNAMTACTVLAARRLERVEVEEYVASHLAHVNEQHVTEQQRTAMQESTAAPVRRVG